MINPNEYEFQESRWQDIYIHLKNKGWDVYAPAQKIGECEKPYLVVKNDGGYKHMVYSSLREMYAILVYVPKLQYSQLEVLTIRLRRDMKELEPMILPYDGGQTQPSYYDDAVKAHYQAIEYENYKKM